MANVDYTSIKNSQWRQSVSVSYKALYTPEHDNGLINSYFNILFCISKCETIRQSLSPTGISMPVQEIEVFPHPELTELDTNVLLYKSSWKAPADKSGQVLLGDFKAKD